MANIRHFTFLPEILPQALARLLTPIECRFEAHRLAVHSAHDLAVRRKRA